MSEKKSEINSIRKLLTYFKSHPYINAFHGETQTHLKFQEKNNGILEFQEVENMVLWNIPLGAGNDEKEPGWTFNKKGFEVVVGDEKTKYFYAEAPKEDEV